MQASARTITATQIGAGSLMPVLFIIFMLLATTAAADTTVPNETQHAPIYRVEVLIFERLDDKLRQSEHWPDTPLEIQWPKALHDPFSPPPCQRLSANETNGHLNADALATPNTSPSAPASQAESVEQAPVQANWIAWQSPDWLLPVACPDGYAYLIEAPSTPSEEAALDAPPTEAAVQDSGLDAATSLPLDGFELVPEATLKDAYQHLKARRGVRVLHYSSWRQPFPPNSPVHNFRLIGGKDYSDQFSLVGLPIVPNTTPLQHDAPDLKSTNLPEASTAQATHEQTSTEPVDPLSDQTEAPVADQDTAEPADNLPQTIAIDHLWALDGWLTLYRKRYLHAELHFQFREPAEREVDILSDLVSGNEDPLADTTRGLNWQFQWQDLDNGETTNTAEKVTFLRGYRIEAERRMRSKEIHYFDHPLIGVLILITPEEQLTDEASEATDTPTESTTNPTTR